MPRVPLGWLAAVLVPSVALAYSSGAQAPATVATPGVRTAVTAPPAPVAAIGPFHRWPPSPQDMVTVGDDFTLPGNSTVQVFTVPSDRWLVVTDVRAYGTTTFLELVEDAAGSLTRKRVLIDGWTYASAASSAAGVGAAFAPGSTVVLQNTNVSSSPATGRYELIGYLAQP